MEDIDVAVGLSPETFTKRSDANENVDDAILASSPLHTRSTDSGILSESASAESLASLTSDDVQVTEPTEEQRQSWGDELDKVQEEMRTLRLVLQAKLRRSSELKHNLGITQFDEIKSDLTTTLKAIQESDAYVKTTTTLKSAGQKTGQVFSSTAFTIKEKMQSGPPGKEKVSNTIFKDAGNKVTEVMNNTGNYVSKSVEGVTSSPSFQAIGVSISTTLGSLKEKLIGPVVDGQVSPADSFLGDVARASDAADGEASSY